MFYIQLSNKDLKNELKENRKSKYNLLKSKNTNTFQLENHNKNIKEIRFILDLRKVNYKKSKFER